MAEKRLVGDCGGNGGEGDGAWPAIYLLFLTVVIAFKTLVALNAGKSWLFKSQLLAHSPPMILTDFGSNYLEII